MNMTNELRKLSGSQDTTKVWKYTIVGLRCVILSFPVINQQTTAPYHSNVFLKTYSDRKERKINSITYMHNKLLCGVNKKTSSDS